MTNEELTGCLNRLSGNTQGLQTLVYALIVSSDLPRRKAILDAFKSEAEHNLAILNAESRQPDEVLHTIEHSYNTTIEWLEELNSLPL